MESLLVYTLKSALVLTLLYLPYTLMLSRERFFRMNRITLLTVLVLALVLPLCDITPLAATGLPQRFLQEAPLLSPVGGMTQNGVDLPLRRGMEEAVGTGGAYTAPSLTAITALIYIIGVSIALGIRMCQLVRIRQIIAGGCLWTDKDSEATVYCHVGDVAPFSWMRSIVISENDYKTNSPTILLHERAHIVCRHSLDIMLLTLVEIVQWWNPMVYWLGHSLRDIHEYEADDHVLHRGVSPADYQMLLLRKAQAGTSLAFANNFNHSQIKKRISMMKRPESNPWLRGKALYILPVTLVVLAAFATPKLNEEVDKVVKEVKTIQLPKATKTTMATANKQIMPIPAPKVMRQKEEPAVKDDVTDPSASDDYVKTIHNNEHCNQYPEFPGGMGALRNYIQQYATKAIDEGAPVAGKQVYVQFRVKTDGTIDDIGLVRGDGEAYREAVKMVEQMPRWVPARNYGKPVNGYFMLPVSFVNDQTTK